MSRPLGGTGGGGVGGLTVDCWTGAVEELEADPDPSTDGTRTTGTLSSVDAGEPRITDTLLPAGSESRKMSLTHLCP